MPPRARFRRAFRRWTNSALTPRLTCRLLLHRQSAAWCFFGTPFLLVKNLPPALYIARLNECLDFLRRAYPGCAWVYRPHPAETGEAAALRLEGFEIETDGEVAELYFLRHARQIAAVFSVSSTVSRVALNFGLPAYCLWRCFPFAAAQQRFFEKVMGDVPPGFELRDLSVPPPVHSGTEGGALSGMALREALRMVLDFLPASRRDCAAIRLAA